MNWNKKKKEEMQNKRIQREQKQSMDEQKMMQDKPKITLYKGYKTSDTFYNLKSKTDKVENNIPNDVINQSNATCYEDPNKIVKSILNSIIKEVPFMSKNNQSIIKRKEALEKYRSELKLREYCKNNG